MFEYNVTYMHVEYLIEPGTGPLERNKLPVDPDPESLFENQTFLDYINVLGRQGWELVNVSPLLRASYSQPLNIAYPLTAGYYFFWKRKIKQTTEE